MRRYDYVIIGSGIAGLYTALLAQKRGSVLILTKGDYGTRPEHFDPKLLGIFTSCGESFRNIFDSDQKA